MTQTGPITLPEPEPGQRGDVVISNFDLTALADGRFLFEAIESPRLPPICRFVMDRADVVSLMAMCGYGLHMSAPNTSTHHY